MMRTTIRVFRSTFTLAAAALACATLTGTAQAAGTHDISSYAHVGQYWCEGASYPVRTKDGTGSIEVQVHTTDVAISNTMFIKAVRADNPNEVLAEAGPFTIPNHTDVTLDHNLFNGQQFRLCAMLGGGDSNPNNLHTWSGKIYY
jgi:hypothetical protein